MEETSKGRKMEDGNFRIVAGKPTWIYDEMILESNNNKTKLKPKKNKGHLDV